MTEGLFPRRREPSTSRARRRKAFVIAIDLCLAILATLTLSGSNTAIPVNASAKPITRPVSRLAVSVRGNELINGQGQPLRLVGVNRSGSEYACVQGRGIFDGPTDSASIAAIKSWHVNVVRVPLNEDCWLGINGVKAAYSGRTYRAAIQAFVARLNAAGLYVILDVHWSAPRSSLSSSQPNMLDASHGYALWRSIATSFKSDPAVLFDLFNEPHDLEWHEGGEWWCWAHGCGAYAGMDGLVSAVRSTGARNVLLVAGLGWASEDNEWLRYEPNDPLHQLALSFHVYGDHSLCTEESCWNATLLPIAERVPVVADEFGEMQCGRPSAISWLRRWMDYATAHRFSMLAWTWDDWERDCEGGPTLITSYAGTPTPYGSAVKSYYAQHGAGR